MIGRISPDGPIRPILLACTAPLEIELRSKLHFARSTGCVSKNLAEGASGQDQVRIGHSKRRRVGYVLSFDTKFEIFRLGEPEPFAEREINVEERWSIKEVPSHIAGLTRSGDKELRTLFRGEENVLTVFESIASEIW